MKRNVYILPLLKRSTMKFQCKRCNYVTEKKDLPKRCPYCGEPNVMERAKQAQDILDEVHVDRRDVDDE